MFSERTETDIKDCIEHMKAKIERELDYDEVEFGYISCGIPADKGFTLNFTVDDTFQRKVESRHWCQNNYLRIYTDTDFSEFYNREERELRVLMSQSGEIKALSDDLVSAAGRKFAKALTATRDEISHFLAASKGTSND